MISMIRPLKTLIRPAAVLVVLVMVLGVAEVRAQDGGFPLLRFGPSAMHAAMGETYTAYATGTAATFGNPAGLAAPVGNVASATYQSWIGETNVYTAAGRFQAGGRGGIGILVSMFGSGTLEAREQPGPGQPFEVQYVSVGASYALQVGPLRAGVTGKFLSERIYSESATGLAVDGGVQTSFFDDHLMFGASVHNIGSMQELGVEATPLPTMIRVGAAAYPIRLYSENDVEPTIRAFVSPEMVFFTGGGDARFHGGLGVEMPGVLSVRGGYLSGDAARRFTFGAGVVYSGFAFDYAFMPLRDDLGAVSHMLTLRYGW